tara:strand:- start:88 stop:693 length:606 start_codon:yes stop_codon:yes gene_type:complete
MTDTLLISWTKVQQYSGINESLDAALIKNAIREAQDIELQRVIGTLLYQKLLAEVKADTLTGAYQTLVNNYIQDMLLYASTYNVIENTFIRARNNGLLTPQGGDNSASVDKTVYEMKRQSVRNKFEYYSDRLSKYIVETQSSFPELSTNTLLYQQLPDYGSQYRSPITFSSHTRSRFTNFARRTGLPIVNSAFPSYPPPKQ